ERGWVDLILCQPQQGGQDDYVDGFRLAEDRTLAEALEELDRVAERTEQVVRAIDDLNQAVPVPKGVPWYPQDLDAWTVRWVLLHLIEEIGRHAGHADIVRESIDGATMFELMAGAEGWPATEWLTPWTPETQDART
ncbi:MAG: mycothiol transferase, partial [Microthrixaceae bacterium]